MTACEVSLLSVSLGCYTTLMILLLTLRRYHGENLIRMSALVSAVFLCLVLAILKGVPPAVAGGLLVVAGVAIGCAVRDIASAGKGNPRDKEAKGRDNQ